MPRQRFKEGMIFAVEIYSGRRAAGANVRVEENVLVAKDGRESLSRWPIEGLPKGVLAAA
jgi:Xaa-Pro aminopeptidase